jgi:hypothetical protein
VQAPSALAVDSAPITGYPETIPRQGCRQSTSNICCVTVSEIRLATIVKECLPTELGFRHSITVQQPPLEKSNQVGGGQYPMPINK